MLRLLVLLALLMPLPLAASEVPAAAPAASPPLAVLVVDVKRILDESKASVSVQKQIEAQRSSFQTEIATKEKFIREAEQELLASRGKMEGPAYAEKENQLRQKFREVEHYVQERRRLLEQATTLSMGKVRSILLGIVTEIAHARGAQAVLIKQQVLWSENSLDITDLVLERLNKRLPDLPVSIDAPASSPPKSPKSSKTP